MVKRRAKRKSGALDRYMKTPSNTEGLSLRNSEKVKIKNPMAEFENEEKERSKPFVIQAKETKPEKEVVVETITHNENTLELQEENRFISDSNMPLYCNYCNLQKSCPHGKKSIKRKDQQELVICVKRKDFRSLVKEAGTNDRESLLKYVHTLRQVNASRIARMIYAEALNGKGHDRSLSLLIDKQIDNVMSEYKLLTPKENNQSGFSFYLTQVHNSVDSFHGLPLNIKQHLLSELKNKLALLKSPSTNLNNNLNPNTNTNNNLNNNTINNKDISNLSFNRLGGAGGEVPA